MSNDRPIANLPDAANLSRIGGEMFSWSDCDPARGPKIVRSGALRYLLAELSGPGESVLIAGPHDEDMLESLVEVGSVVTCLVRSFSDAQRLATRFPYVTVLCGSVAKLDTTARFDLVVAVDGTDRLVSAEQEQQSVSDVLHVLASLLVPGGIFALMYDNLLGIHHVVELDSGAHYESDAAWYPVSEYDVPRPASLAQIEEHLVSEGLTVENAYAVYPTPQAPSVFIGRDLVGDTASGFRGHLGAVLGQAFTAAYRGERVLADPRRLTVRALRAGAEGVVAPAWLSIVRRGASDIPVPSHGIVVGDGADAYTYELSVADGTPQMRVLVPSEERGEFARMRRVVDLSTQAAPPGRVYEERLLQLCAYADLPGIRAEFGRFVAWLEAHAQDGVISGPVALSTTDTVLDDGYDFFPLPPRWEPVEPSPVDTVIVRAAWGFAVRIITGHHPHPWPVTADAEELTALILSTAGRTVDETVLRDAIDLEVRYRAADERLDPDEEEALRATLIAVQPGMASVDIQEYRAMANALWRQQYEVDHLRSTLEWTEQIIRSRDHTLSRLDWEIQLYKSSFTATFFKLMRSVYHTVRRDARTLFRRVRSSRVDKKQIEDATEF